jgi:apolipoprotein N-acyltransferase
MRKRGWPVVIAFPLTLAASERVYPMFFPWSTALLFHDVPLLLQTADLGGTIAISVWVGFVDAALAVAWLRHSERRSLIRFGITMPAMTAVVVVAYGALRMRSVDDVTRAAPAATIGVVQGNIEHADEGAIDPLPLYRQMSRDLLARETVDLLIWPESAAGRIVREDMMSSFMASQIFGRSAFGHEQEAPMTAPILTGVIIERSNAAERGAMPSETRARFNSAVLASASGRVLGEYDKRSLVPLGEYLPHERRLPWLRRLLPAAGAFSAGSNLVALQLGDKRILPLICLEDILAERVRDDVETTEPDVLVNLTSDAWFGESRLADLHFAIARLRAVEHRRFLVHATNTGVTAVVDPNGRIVTLLPKHVRTTSVTTVHFLRGSTMYGKTGLGLAYLAAACTLAIACVRRRHRVRQSKERKV